MDILSSNKVLQLEPLAPLIRQGERLADNPVFVLPKMRDGIDQTALAWEIRATSDHDTIVIQSLTADLTGTDIRLPWVVEGEFTAVAGALYITLCGKSATSDIVVKYVGSTALRVLAAEEGAYAPPPNIAEQTYQQRAAAEAAAASADATLAQTQALKDQVQVIVAGNEAHTKSESNARFAGALVVKESGNPITVYPDATGAPLTAISQRGKTTQPGTGDPSPTNIRPIYGVGQYDGKYVANKSSAWRNPSWDTSKRIIELVYMFPVVIPVKYILSTKIEDIASSISLKTSGFLNITVKPEYAGDDVVQRFKDLLDDRNIVIYYQSTSYSTANQVYCGLSITDETGYHGYAAGPMAPLYDGDTLDFVSGTVNRKCRRLSLDGTNGGLSVISNTNGLLRIMLSDITMAKNLDDTSENIMASHYKHGNTLNCIKKGAGNEHPFIWVSLADYPNLGVYNSYLAAQHAAGTPVTIVHQLATPTTETVAITEPITYAPGPITIAAENTVDVTYNKSLAKAFEQITAAIASLGTV